ncbi:hypothetical protein Q4I30_007556 [Leishmania utingensis]|uniref:Uncharacterized protein n=1 Tax=Leishmania utingensis TaxID=653362 RepID=A0AAW2ZWH5_9TRYP
MTLDFDVDDAPTFPELVRDARCDVMKGRAMSACWSELADQHTFFKDIAKEGRTRAETFAAVLTAVQGICQAVQRVDLFNSEVEVPSLACTSSFSSPAQGAAGGTWPGSRLEEAQTLAQVARAYLNLYCSTPIPTRAEWVSSLQFLFPQSLNAVSTEANGASAPCPDGDVDAVLTTPTSSTLGRYLTKLRQRVDGVLKELPESEVDGNDGSFVEDELRELLLCCMTVGRRVARATTLPSSDAGLTREMVKALRDFVGSSTLEW